MRELRVGGGQEGRLLPSSLDFDHHNRLESTAATARPMPSNLPDLPPSVLQRILAEALTADPNLAPTLLSSLGRSIAAAASATLFERILLEDDDSLLVAAEEEEDAPARNVLAAVWRSKEAGGCVRSLTILRPSPIEGRTPDPSNPLEPFTFDGGAAPTDLSEPAPLDPHSFAQLLLPKFTNLTSFTWASSRLPPADLCIALGAAAKNLSSFSLDLASTSTTSGVPGSPRTSIRWDAEQLSALPVSVSQLSLAHLSLEGSRELARAFTLIPNLEKLELSRTLFVDDALLEAMAEGAKRLAKLAIRDMAGTKLTEKGIGAVLDSVDGCTALEELILDSVEGRHPLSLSRCRDSSRIFPSSQVDSQRLAGAASLLSLPLSTSSASPSPSKDPTSLGAQITSIRLPTLPPPRTFTRSRSLVGRRTARESSDSTRSRASRSRTSSRRVR